MSITSIMIRLMFSRGDRKRDKELTTPEGIQRYDNIAYGPYGKWNLLDVYRPKGAEGPLPVIVIVHGGGWVYGTKEVYQYYGMSLARKGFAVVNYSYRLAPRHRYPASFEDTNHVIEWMCSNKDSYGFDMDNTFLFGDSAGAHMTAIYSSICTNDSYAANYRFKVPYGFKPKAVALNCGMYDIQTIKSERTKAYPLLLDLLGNKDLDKKVDLINPYLHMTSDFPKTFLMSATGDFLVNEVSDMEKKLKELGVEYVSRIYGDESEKPPHVFHCNIRDKYAKQCNEDTSEQMKRWI